VSGSILSDSEGDRACYDPDDGAYEMIFEAVASGGKTVPQMLSEAAATVSFKLSLLDVRDRDAFEKGHIPGARRKQ